MDSLKISMYGLNKSLYKQAKLGNLPIQTAARTEDPNNDHGMEGGRRMRVVVGLKGESFSFIYCCFEKSCWKKHLRVQDNHKKYCG